MARGSIFITKSVERKEIMGTYWYSYQEENSLLRVYKGQAMIDERNAELGEAFEVLTKGENNENHFIFTMTPPRRRGEAIAWLLGYGKRERAPTYEEYLEICKRKRDRFETDEYFESILNGPNFEFCEVSFVGDSEGYRNLACWVDEDISKEEIIQLIPEYVYPEIFTRRVLEERFGVSKNEFDIALALFD